MRRRYLAAVRACPLHYSRCYCLEWLILTPGPRAHKTLIRSRYRMKLFALKILDIPEAWFGFNIWSKAEPVILKNTSAIEKKDKGLKYLTVAQMVAIRERPILDCGVRVRKSWYLRCSLVFSHLIYKSRTQTNPLTSDLAIERCTIRNLDFHTVSHHCLLFLFYRYIYTTRHSL